MTSYRRLVQSKASAHSNVVSDGFFLIQSKIKIDPSTTTLHQIRRRISIFNSILHLIQEHMLLGLIKTSPPQKNSISSEYVAFTRMKAMFPAFGVNFRDQRCWLRQASSRTEVSKLVTASEVCWFNQP